jgi:hypothetical protein
VTACNRRAERVEKRQGRVATTTVSRVGTGLPSTGRSAVSARPTFRPGSSLTISSGVKRTSGSCGRRRRRSGCSGHPPRPAACRRGQCGCRPGDHRCPARSGQVQVRHQFAVEAAARQLGRQHVDHYPAHVDASSTSTTTPRTRPHASTADQPPRRPHRLHRRGFARSRGLALER